MVLCAEEQQIEAVKTFVAALRECYCELEACSLLQDSLKAEHFLWQLFHIEKDIKEAVDDAKEQKEQLNESARVLYAREQQVEAKKKIVAGFQKERLLLERKLKKRKSEAEKKARHSTMHCCQDHSRFACAGLASDDRIPSLLKERAVRIDYSKEIRGQGCEHDSHLEETDQELPCHTFVCLSRC